MSVPSSSDTSSTGSSGPGRSAVGGPHVKPSARATESASANPDRLVQETRDQIRALVDEVSRLARTDCPPDRFFEGFLNRITTALAAVGGAVWLRETAEEPFSLIRQVNLAHSGLADDAARQEQHGRLLERIATGGQPVLVPAGSGAKDDPDNPTEHLLVLAPIMVEQHAAGLVEIFQRADAGPTTQRGYLRFLVQMARVAGEYLQNERLRQYARQHATWQQYQSFVESIHRGLDVRQTAAAIANEGRRVLGCQRVSVAVRQAGRYGILSISGLDSIERRADQVKRLGRLTSAVCQAGQTVWYAGDDTNLPPQIETRLHEYLDLSHSRDVIIQPLRRPSPQDGEGGEGQAEGPVIGALIVESTDQDGSPAARQEELQRLSSHSQAALANALRHSNLFLAPLWDWLGNSLPVTAARNVPRTLLAAGLLLAALIAMWFVPSPFTLGSSGKLVPLQRTEIYAQVDGVLQELRVPDDPSAVVEAGAVLAVMDNNQLLVGIRNLQGQLGQAEEKSRKLQRALTRQTGLGVVDRGIMEGDLSEASQLQESLARQLQLKMEELDLLTIRAPVPGCVVNWQLRQNLLRRPVQRGQNLMTIVPPETPWQIELEFPERRIAHLTQALADADHPLDVQFTLASHPGTAYSGKLVSMDNQLDVSGDQGNVVLLRVAIDSGMLPAELLRSGTRVTARIQAGHRSLGYVWFHELLETVHATWLMWF